MAVPMRMKTNRFSQIINGKEYTDVLKAMDTIADYCAKISEHAKKMTTKSNNSLTTAVADIKQFRQEVNQRLDELEKQAKAIQQENVNHLKSVETTCDDVTKSLKKSSKSIKHLNTSNSVDLENAKKMIKDYEETIQQIATHAVKEYNFQPNEKLSTQLDKGNSLGTLSQKPLRKIRLPRVFDVESRQTTEKDEICIETSNDRESCCITGMSLITPGLLAIADCSNNAIKLVDTCSKAITDQLQLEAWDITSVSNTELAVTLPGKQKIQFVSVLSNKLTEIRHLKVDGHCYGVSCNQGKLVVSFIGPAKLQILDISGTILKSVSDESSFCSLFYVATNSDDIYVSDWTKEKVTKLNWQGEVIGNCSIMGKPEGIAVSEDGAIFVCDYYRNVLKQISGDCSEGKAVLTDLKRPSAICWSADTSDLYLSCNYGDKTYDNYIHIFRLS